MQGFLGFKPFDSSTLCVFDWFKEGVPGSGDGCCDIFADCAAFGCMGELLITGELFESEVLGSVKLVICATDVPI